MPMKFSNLNRIYVNSKLNENSLLTLMGDHFHYLKNVLRLRINDHFRIFNPDNGEFIVQIIEITKNNLSVNISKCLRQPYSLDTTQLTLGLSIIKMDKMLDAINMAVQLGVDRIVPLITERSQLRHINEQKVLKSIIEATEQSERLNLAILEPLIPLDQYLNQHQNDIVIYANENEVTQNSLLEICSLTSNISFIVGPEGGFSSQELSMLLSYSNARSISLSANILRTETAVAAGLAQLGLVKNSYECKNTISS